MLVPFEPPPGLNSDDTTLSSTPAWVDGYNMRFRLGRPQPVGASTSLGTIGISGTVVDIFEFTRSGTLTYAYGTTTAATSLYVGDIFTPVARTPAGSPSTTFGWSFAPWGDVLLGAIYTGTLYQQTASSAAAEVTQAPDRIDAGILVTPERQVLAFACNEEGSGTFNRLCIRGSDIEDYTDWTTTASNNAFEHILDGPGSIIAARQVGNYVAVWTSTALWLGQFVGDPGQTYRFDKIAAIVPPMSRRSVCAVDGGAYWMGIDGRLYTWAPGSPVSFIPCPIMNDFVTYYGDPTKQAFSYMVAHRERSEIWFFYYDTRNGGSQLAKRYIAYSIAESALAQRPVWFRGDLLTPASLVGPSAAIYCINNARSVVPTGFFGIAESGGFCQLDIEDPTYAGITDAYIQSGDFYLDETERRVMVKGIRPDFKNLRTSSPATVTLTLYFRDYPQGTPVTKGPFTLTSATTKKDFRGSGKIVAAKWASAGSYWRLGKPLFDVVPTGER